jgi:glycosyltransferase involved in cell wall biosynthesis
MMRNPTDEQELSQGGHPRISIIVPVYNAQAHIAECLSRIQVQTSQSWECVCVDDGSSDESAQIVESFAAKDDRFHLIRQSNAGPGVARNVGLEAARGDYFTFVDADDCVHPEMLERLLLLSETHQADLVVCGHLRFTSDGEFAESLVNPDLPDGRAEVVHAPLLPGMVDWGKFRVHPWGKLYQRSVHGGLRFPALRGSEDAYVSFDVYGRSKRAVFSTMRLYGYRIVDDGLTRSISRYRNYIRGDAEVAAHGAAICRKQGVSRAIAKQLIMPYIMRVFCFLNAMSRDPGLSSEEKKSLVRIGRAGLQNIRRSVAGEYRIIPPVHFVSYWAVRLHAPRLLFLWQYVRMSLSRLWRTKHSDPVTVSDFGMPSGQSQIVPGENAGTNGDVKFSPQ